MLNLNRNGKINAGDYIYLTRHMVLVLSSIALGYTISDIDPRIHSVFTTPMGQFLSIFMFLASGLVKFRNNANVVYELLFMFMVSIGCTVLLQTIKEKIRNSNVDG
jgi:hypothetical protein